jgi:hypothetical protein
LGGMDERVERTISLSKRSTVVCRSECVGCTLVIWPLTTVVRSFG